MLHRHLTHIGVARAIGDEETIEVYLVEVIVPGDPVECDLGTNEVAHDVVLRTTIYEYHFLRTIAVDRDLLGGGFRY